MLHNLKWDFCAVSRSAPHTSALAALFMMNKLERLAKGTSLAGAQFLLLISVFDHRFMPEVLLGENMYLFLRLVGFIFSHKKKSNKK